MVEPKVVSGEDMAEGQTPRHQDAGGKVRCKIVQDDLEVPGLVM